MTSSPQSFAWVDRVVGGLLGAVVAIILFLMMTLTCADVIGRYFLNRPVYGAFELTETMLACLIFAALPLVTLDQGHVTVDVLDGVTPGPVLRIQHILAALIASAATGYLAWRLWVRGMNMLAAGETTAQLKLALGYLATSMAGLMALTALASLVLVFRRPRRQSASEV
jgi:TRAP-type C4-dicarboxylate transport system permease small subunit